MPALKNTRLIQGKRSWRSSKSYIKYKKEKRGKKKGGRANGLHRRAMRTEYHRLKRKKASGETMGGGLGVSTMAPKSRDEVEILRHDGRMK